jgi:hypothetical protein
MVVAVTIFRNEGNPGAVPRYRAVRTLGAVVLRVMLSCRLGRKVLSPVGSNWGSVPN